MNFLICSKISIPAKDRTLPAWEYLRSLGHIVAVDHPSLVYGVGTEPDVIISMGVTIMEETFEAIKRWPNVPLYCYNWDCYEWVWTNPRSGEYDYARYGELLSKAIEVWVPSECTADRTHHWWGLTNTRVILSACPYWDYDNVRDDGYALCCLREIPDRYWGRFERVCKDLGIPYKMTMHEQTYEDYQDAIAGCRFLVSDLYELSTGGLSLMEGYYLGKPCLLSDSRWHGGRDYMGDRAMYFQHDDDNSFRDAMMLMSKHPPKLDREECKRWIEANYSDERMARDIANRIETVVDRV